MCYITGIIKPSKYHADKSSIEVKFGFDDECTEVTVTTVSSGFGYTYKFNENSNHTGYDQIAVAELATVFFEDYGESEIIGGRMPMLYFLLTNMTEYEKRMLIRACLSYNGRRDRPYMIKFTSFVLRFYELKSPKLMKRTRMEYKLECH